jgi:hypothetical protein
VALCLDSQVQGLDNSGGGGRHGGVHLPLIVVLVAVDWRY